MFTQRITMCASTVHFDFTQILIWHIRVKGFHWEDFVKLYNSENTANIQENKNTQSNYVFLISIKRIIYLTARCRFDSILRKWLLQMCIVFEMYKHKLIKHDKGNKVHAFFPWHLKYTFWKAKTPPNGVFVCCVSLQSNKWWQMLSKTAARYFRKHAI